MMPSNEDTPLFFPMRNQIYKLCDMTVLLFDETKLMPSQDKTCDHNLDVYMFKCFIHNT